MLLASEKLFKESHIHRNLPHGIVSQPRTPSLEFLEDRPPQIPEGVVRAGRLQGVRCRLMISKGRASQSQDPGSVSLSWVMNGSQSKRRGSCGEPPGGSVENERAFLSPGRGMLV